ncbi:MAG TPA: acylphosphatase [Patescibacteria group bacterium]|nr:acylphosphatase [Patescibacteria group bacterium]
MDKHVHIKISGRVQGIGFRFSIYEKMVELDLPKGRAENQQDGSVLVDVEGPEDKLELLAEYCRRGPQGARVSAVDISELAEPFIPLKNG